MAAEHQDRAFWFGVTSCGCGFGVYPTLLLD